MQLNNEFDEQRALIRLANGEMAAFQEIYDRYWRLVFEILKRRLNSADLAEDVTQDIFMDLWQRRRSIHTVVALRYYFPIIAKNKVGELYKKFESETSGGSACVAGSAGQPKELLHAYSDREDYYAVIKSTLPLLTPTQQEVYHLLKEEGLTHEAAARRLNISREAVKQSMVSALHFIRNHLRNHLAGVIIGFMCCYELFVGACGVAIMLSQCFFVH